MKHRWRNPAIHWSVDFNFTLTTYDFNRFQSPPFVAVAVIVTVRRAFFSLLLLLQSGLVSNEIFMLKASVKKRRDDDDNSQKYLGDEYVIDL